MKIIAEFCQNHNGKADTLKRMISEAAEGGATHGKIQTIFADDLSFREEFETGSLDEHGKTQTIKRPYQSEYDRLKKLELNYEQHRQFIEECDKAGLIPLTTAFNLTAIPHIKEFSWKVIKVASYDCPSIPLIKELCKYFDELIVSTGASYDNEIEETAGYLNSIQKNFTFLHCVTIYPTPLDQMNLSRMDYLRKFTDQVGLSDHSLVSRDGVKAALAAIYLGATALERHFTILSPEETKDGKVSIDKTDLEEIVSFSNLSKPDQKSYIGEHIPEFDSMIGKQKRDLSDEELLNRAYYRGRFCNKVNGKQLFNWESF